MSSLIDWAKMGEWTETAQNKSSTSAFTESEQRSINASLSCTILIGPSLFTYFHFVCCCSGSGLRCYKCSDYTGRCQNVQECTYEDSCMSLSERGQW